MAEIQTTTTLLKPGKPVQKRLSTRIDLTPMVDLGFLLITFFIFTTALSTPSVIKLNLPEDGPPTNYSEDKTLCLVLGSDNEIGYYSGSTEDAMQFTNYSASGIRSRIQLAQRLVQQKFGTREQLNVIIKPTKESSYKNVVDVLDEMLINDVKRYVLTEADEQEEILMSKN